MPLAERCHSLGTALDGKTPRRRQRPQISQNDEARRAVEDQEHWEPRRQAKSGTDASANAVTTRTRGRRGYTLNEAASAANGRVIAARIKNT